MMIPKGRAFLWNQNEPSNCGTKQLDSFSYFALIYVYIYILVGGLEHFYTFFIFPFIGNNHPN